MKNPTPSGVIVPPPIVFFLGIIIGVAIDQLWPLPVLPNLLQYIFGGAVIILSFVLFGAVLKEFSRSKTSIDHKLPTTEIICSGPFRYSRNPVYLSLVMLCVGVAIASDNPWIVLTTLPAIIAVHHFVILKEENYLIDKFGDEYRAYMKTVRRWI